MRPEWEFPECPAFTTFTSIGLALARPSTEMLLCEGKGNEIRNGYHYSFIILHSYRYPNTHLRQDQLCQSIFSFPDAMLMPIHNSAFSPIEQRLSRHK